MIFCFVILLLGLNLGFFSPFLLILGVAMGALSYLFSLLKLAATVASDFSLTKMIIFISVTVSMYLSDPLWGSSVVLVSTTLWRDLARQQNVAMLR